MRRTTGSCSARLRALPLLAAPLAPLPFPERPFVSRDDAVSATPPGSTCTLMGRPAAPLAAAVAMRRASDVNDISSIVLEAATLAVRELPSNVQFAVSSREASMG